MYISRRDFDRVLKATFQAQWDTILKSLSFFRYFDDFDEASKKECCTVSKILEYKIGDLIYEDERVSGRFVYFILEGQCRVIEHLPIVSREVLGKKKYGVFDGSAVEKRLRYNVRRNKGKTIDKTIDKTIGKTIDCKTNNYSKNNRQNRAEVSPNTEIIYLQVST